MRVFHVLAAVALATGCSGDDGGVGQQQELPDLKANVAIVNGGSEPVDVTLTSAFDETTTFEAVLPGATTTFEEITFKWLEEVEVSCASGCVSGQLDLVQDDANTILVTEDGPPVLNPEDTVPPEVTLITPANGSNNVALNTAVTVTFSEAMDPASIATNGSDTTCSGSVQLSSDGFGNCVTLAAPTSDDDITFAAVPVDDLEPSTVYRIKITRDAVDAFGTGLVADVVTTGFQTGLEADDGPPDAITDLEVGTVTATSVELEWTAVGDDADEGTASSYDVRYAEGGCPFTFSTGTRASGEPSPKEAGGDESFEVTGLEDETEYCFAVQVADEVPNLSEDSNFVSATTLINNDSTAPAAASITVDGATENSLRVNWTAVGDDGNTGTADSYELRYSRGSCSGTTATSGTVVGSMPAPLAAGTNQSKTVTGLLDDERYCFALKVMDENGNESVSNEASGRTEAGFW